MSKEFPEIIPRVETYGTQRAFRYKDIRYRLKGSICKGCNEKYFPAREGSLCPKCGGREFEDYYPPKTGQVDAHWLDNIGYPASGYTDGFQRSIVTVRLDDGLHIVSEVVDCEERELKKGTRVRMAFRKHKREETGNFTYGYKFVLDED